MVSASGDQMKIKGKADVSFQFDDIYCPITVLVAEMDIDVILGLDFMNQYKVKINITSNTITLDETVIECYCLGKVGCFRVVLTEKIEVPARTEIIVYGRVTDPDFKNLQFGLVEPSESMVTKDKGLVARSLVRAAETVPVRIANFSDEPETFYRGTNIATVTQVKGIENCKN